MITRGGLTHELGFLERVLELREIPDIETVVNKLVDEIKGSSAPRRIRVGGSAS
jgi:hypothetical protein